MLSTGTGWRVQRRLLMIKLISERPIDHNTSVIIIVIIITISHVINSFRAKQQNIPTSDRDKP